MNIHRVFRKFWFWVRYYLLIYFRSDPQIISMKQCMSQQLDESQLEPEQIQELKAFRQIYCQGPILDAVQNAKLFSDSKYFVDMAIKYDPSSYLNKYAYRENNKYKNHISDEALQDFYALGKEKNDKKALKKFVEEHFYAPGTELETCYPEDWKSHPLNLKKIRDPKFREWAVKLNDLWKQLCRQVKIEVYYYPERFSMLYVPHPFIIPGGRFREFYYWDSYWINKGLIFSEMFETVKGMIRNYGYMIQKFGFVPNGGRVYYLTRSQPPLLTPMVYDYFMATRDMSFLIEMLPILEEEFKFWTHSRRTMFDDGSEMYQHVVRMNVPRPESYREDMTLVGHVTSIRNLTNSLLYKGEYVKAKTIMQRHHWNEEDGIWYDYDIETKQQRREYYLSNVLPLFAHCYDENENVPRKVYNYLDKIGAFKHSRGIPTSFLKSEQQWDNTNAWPPLIHMLIEGFRTSNDRKLKGYARNLAEQWLLCNYEGFVKTGYMYEKYNIDSTGNFAGSGGEYEVQAGFGWTNGVVLDLLMKFGDAVRSQEPRFSFK